jgi:PTS system glucose-specific IIA component
MFQKLFGKNKFQVISPMTGTLLPLDQVPDPVFAQKMAGDGVAIQPSEGKVVAPFMGKIIHFFDSKHAITLENENGLQILIHIGIDTVKLNGDSFTSLVKVGDQVNLGDPLLEFDLQVIEKAGYSSISPIIIINGDIVKEQTAVESKTVTAGQDPILHISLK